MMSTYTDAIGICLHVLAALAGVVTILLPLAAATLLARTPARHITWRYDAWRYRRNH